MRIFRSIIFLIVFCFCASIASAELDGSLLNQMTLVSRHQLVDSSKVWWIKNDITNGIYRVDNGAAEGYQLIFLKDGHDSAILYFEENEPAYGDALVIELPREFKKIILPTFNNNSQRFIPIYVQDLNLKTTTEYGVEEKVTLAPGVENSSNAFFIVHGHYVFLDGTTMVFSDNATNSNIKDVTTVFKNSKNESQAFDNNPEDLKAHITEVMGKLQGNGYLSNTVGKSETNFFECVDPLNCGRGETYIGGNGGASLATNFECEVLPDCCCEDGKGRGSDGKCYRPLVLVPGAGGDPTDGEIGKVLKDTEDYPCEANVLPVSRDPSELCWLKKGKALAKEICAASVKCNGASVEPIALCAGGIVLNQAIPFIDCPVDMQFWNTPFDTGAKFWATMAGWCMDTICLGFNHVDVGVWPVSREQCAIRYWSSPHNRHTLKSNQSAVCHVGGSDGIIDPDNQVRGPVGCTVELHPEGGHSMLGEEYKHRTCCGDGAVHKEAGEECEGEGSRCYKDEWPWPPLGVEGRCTEECKCNTKFCGNGKIDPGEECDAGPPDGSGPINTGPYGGGVCDQCVLGGWSGSGGAQPAPTSGGPVPPPCNKETNTDLCPTRGCPDPDEKCVADWGFGSGCVCKKTTPTEGEGLDN